MQEVILVKLGEIVLKGLNRRTFEDRLLKNIRRRIARAGNFEVYSMQSTIYIEPKDEDADIDEAEERISKIFGVIGYARACVCEKDMDAITKMAPEYLNDTLAGFKTFKVESKRADKKFPLGSMEISRETKGAFDITIAPLANAWGFGFKKGAFPDSLMIDSLLQITGYEKVKLENGKVVKQDPRIMLSCSAVAKGYSVDVIARLLDRKGIKNYMVDIGGEVVVKGKNATGDLWRIGINKPYDDSLAVKQDIQVVLNLTDLGMATSGNYRNYYYKDGKKYAHTIDPRTGYPVQHSILSSTVIAEDCMTADALATSFMVMGLEEAEKFCKANPMIDAYFIYSGENGEFKTYYTDGMKRYMPDAK